MWTVCKPTEISSLLSPAAVATGCSPQAPALAAGFLPGWRSRANGGKQSTARTPPGPAGSSGAEGRVWGRDLRADTLRPGSRLPLGGWLSEKVFRARLPSGARGSQRVSAHRAGGQHPGRGAGAQGKHHPRGPGLAGSGARGKWREGSGGGRRRRPSGLAPAQRAPPAPAGEACPPRARAALGAGGGRSCAAAAGVRRWGRARSGDSRAAALPALPSAAAGTDGVVLRSRGWRMRWRRTTLVVPVGAGGCAEPEAVAGETALASRGRRGAAAVSPPVGTGLFWRKGSAVSPEEWAPLPSSGRRDPCAPCQSCGRRRRAWRCGCPTAPGAVRDGSRPCSEPASPAGRRYVERDVGLPGPPAALGGARLLPADVPGREDGSARRPESRSTENHFAVKTVVALRRNRYRVRWNVFEEWVNGKDHRISFSHTNNGERDKATGRPCRGAEMWCKVYAFIAQLPRFTLTIGRTYCLITYLVMFRPVQISEISLPANTVKLAAFYLH